MSEPTSDQGKGETRWLGILAAFGVVWYLLLAAQFGLSFFTTAEDLAATGMTPEQVAYVKATPIWANSAKSIAVVAGLFGAIALFL